MIDRMTPHVAVVIPCFKVRSFIGDVLARIGPEVSRIYVVDDACPERTGEWVSQTQSDPRIQVVTLPTNQGVGGAVMAGYKQALADGMHVVVKVDGDGQIDPALIPLLVSPVLSGLCDYAKGNRFHRLEDLAEMPGIRLFGNGVLSFLTKLSGGYWHVFDPANGFTAIHAAVLAELPLGKIDRRYFFESDMLFRLNTARAVVMDVPMRARYGAEVSNIRIAQAIPEFLAKHARNFCKRVFYNYFLRDMTIASLQLVLALLLLPFGVVFGLHAWAQSIATHVTASSGTVMLAALPTILGMEFLLAFFNYDIEHEPRIPLHKKLPALPAGLSLSR